MTFFVEVVELVVDPPEDLQAPALSVEERRDIQREFKQKTFRYPIEVYLGGSSLEEETAQRALNVYRDALAIAEFKSGVDSSLGALADDECDPYADIVLSAEIEHWNIEVTSMIDCDLIELRISESSNLKVGFSFPSYFALTFEPREEAHEMNIQAYDPHLDWIALERQFGELRERIIAPLAHQASGAISASIVSDRINRHAEG